VPHRLRQDPLQQGMPASCVLLWAGVQVMVSAVCQVGADINQMASAPWRAHTLQFVAGLGPRKAAALLRAVQVRRLPAECVELLHVALRGSLGKGAQEEGSMAGKGGHMQHHAPSLVSHVTAQLNGGYVESRLALKKGVDEEGEEGGGTHLLGTKVSRHPLTAHVSMHVPTISGWCA